MCRCCRQDYASYYSNSFVHRANRQKVCCKSALQVRFKFTPVLKLAQLLIVGKWCKRYKCGCKCACDSKKCACDSKKCVSSACPVPTEICNFGLQEFGAKMMVAQMSSKFWTQHSSTSRLMQFRWKQHKKSYTKKMHLKCVCAQHFAR